MTTLYKPVLIESAEQAEALPIGTVAKRAKWHESGYQDYYSAVRVGYNAWFTTSDTADRQDSLSRHMIGWTALVPIEAEEETREHPTRVEERPESAYLQPVQQVRYKTRWETA